MNIVEMNPEKLAKGIGGLFKDIRAAITGKEVLDPSKQLEILSQMQQVESEVISYKKDIIVAEAKGESWLQRNWRPMLMCAFGLIIVNNYILFPYIQLFGFKAVVLEMPEKLWNLLTLGVGGYVVGRSVEKGVKAWKGK